MPPKLGHKKSRTGCTRCKLRKVKCDERHPCSNCTKHNVQCEYVNGLSRAAVISHRTSISANARQVDATQNTVGPGPSSPYIDLEDIDHAFTVEERRLLELRLINHFTTIVTYTFPPCHEQRFRDLYNIDAVRLALEHPFLLNAILAISSLHLVSDTGKEDYIYARDTNELSVGRVLQTSIDPAERDIYTRAHRIYLNLAIRQQRQIIPHLNINNADAIFMASVLLSYQTLNLLKPMLDPAVYKPPIQWLSISKAIADIIEASKIMEIIQSNSLSNLITQMGGEPDFRNQMALFDPLHRKPFSELLDWTKYPEPGLDDEIINTYERTLAYVGSCYRSFLDNEPPRVLIRRLMILGVLVPAQFITLLAEGRPRALVILAHHFAISQAVDKHWWFRGAAEREVLGVQSLLPPEWQWAMEWPLSMLKLGR